MSDEPLPPNSKPVSKSDRKEIVAVLGELVEPLDRILVILMWHARLKVAVGVFLVAIVCIQFWSMALRCSSSKVRW